MRRRLAWGLVLPLAFGGSEAAHNLAYRLAYPQSPVRERTLHATGHAYFRGLPFMLALGFTVVVVVLVAMAVEAARGRPARTTPAWAFALVSPATFAIQEVVELALHTGTLGWQAVLEPTFVPGLLLQLPCAAAAYLLARLLLRVARRVGAAFASPRIARTHAIHPVAVTAKQEDRIPVASARPRAPPYAVAG